MLARSQQKQPMLGRLPSTQSKSGSGIYCIVYHRSRGRCDVTAGLLNHGDVFFSRFPTRGTTAGDVINAAHCCRQFRPWDENDSPLSEGRKDIKRPLPPGLVLSTTMGNKVEGSLVRTRHGNQASGRLSGNLYFLPELWQGMTYICHRQTDRKGLWACGIARFKAPRPFRPAALARAVAGAPS